MNTGIYTITNLINSKIYVGSTSKSFKYRFKEHIRTLKTNKHRNSRLQNAWNKYGKENFVFEILEKYEPKYCIGAEQWWMNMLNVCNDKFGYNIAPVAGSSLGQKRTEEQKLNIRKSLKGTKEGAKNHRFGTKWSDETREKILNSTRNKPVLQYDLEGNFIREFKSLMDVQRFLNKSFSSISKVCRKLKKYKTAYGFKWEFKIK
jgi:hypothetical protein